MWEDKWLIIKTFFRSVITIINAVVSLLLLICIPILYIRPEYLSIFAFLGFGFFILWLANLVFLAFWIIRRRVQLAISLSVLIISLPVFWDVFQINIWSSADKSDIPNSFKMMSFNVRMFDFYNWIDDKNTAKNIFQLIKQRNPDVLCIQEFFVGDRGEYSEANVLAQFKKYPYRHIEYIASHNSSRHFGMATFSKYPILNRKAIKFKNTTNFGIYTDINFKGQRIRVFNNHLESVRLGGADYKAIKDFGVINDDAQKKEMTLIFGKLNKSLSARATQAEVLATQIAKSPYPTIVCGDFNDIPVSYVYHTMRGDLEDAFVEAGNGFGGTYNGKLPSFRIDFIFHTDNFNTYNFKLDKVELSDHYPISCDLELEKD